MRRRRRTTRKLRVAWDNLFEQFGKAFGPAVEKGMGRLAKFIRQMQNGKGAGGEFADTLKISAAPKDVGYVIGPPLKAIGQFVFDHQKVTAMACRARPVPVATGSSSACAGGGSGKLGGSAGRSGSTKPSRCS